MKMTASEERALVRRTLTGDTPARARLVGAQQGLVAALARRHASRVVELEELESAGREALMTTLERLADYDPALGRLATWLGPSIEGAILKAAAREERSRRALESLRQSDKGESESALDRRGGLDPGLAELLGDEVDRVDLAPPGPASSRDPYLQADRYPDAKQALLIVLRQDDPLATVHGPTWLKLTRSPALAAVLEQVRNGVEDSVARLAQEYQNLAPAAQTKRVSRTFLQRDARSDALARISRHAALSGSLPERAQWAALGAPETVSAVGQFRHLVLGGEPAELWPESGLRFLAAEHWVEEQAKREADPDPEYILTYGEGKRRAIARGEALDDLKRCAGTLVRDYGWREEHAVRFIITDFAQNAPKLRGGVHSGGLYGAQARVVMDIDPRTSPAEVARLYEKWRASLALMGGEGAYPDRDRSMKERTLALAVFIEEHWHPERGWCDLRAEWNEDHPAWCFPDGAQDPGANNFANHARQAWSRLSGARWPAAASAALTAARVSKARRGRGRSAHEPQEPAE